MRQGDYDEAERLFRESLALFRELDDARAVGVRADQPGIAGGGAGAIRRCGAAPGGVRDARTQPSAMLTFSQ